MRRVRDADEQMAWLAPRPDDERATGYAPDGWEVDTWVLHAMYENPRLEGLGTHDEWHHRRLNAGEVAPTLIGDVTLDDVSTHTGTPLGFISRPDSTWRRVRWSDYLAKTPDFQGNHTVPPCHRWFPHTSWPVSLFPPPEGSLDEESLHALLDVLATHSPNSAATHCLAFYASLPAIDFDTLHLWHGPLSGVPALLEVNGGPYGFTPTNLWPENRAWFIWTDYDLQATRISGSRNLINAITAAAPLETLEWHRPVKPQ